MERRQIFSQTVGESKNEPTDFTGAGRCKTENYVYRKTDGLCGRVTDVTSPMVLYDICYILPV